jgi:hypothetical protein
MGASTSDKAAGRTTRFFHNQYSTLLSLNKVCPFTSQETPNANNAIVSNIITGNIFEITVCLKNNV